MAKRLIDIAVLILIVAICACTAKPTEPGFPFTGTWKGYFKDYIAGDITGVPSGCSLTLNVGSDGSASASGSKREEYSNGVLSDKVSMVLNVLPDGSVYGTGQWNFSFTGIIGLNGEGEVYGQLDSESGIGSGDLLIEWEDILWHFPWRVEKEK